MPKVFSSSETKDLKVLDNPAVVSAALRRAALPARSSRTPFASSHQKPPSVQFSLSQLYTLKMGNTEKLVKSLITLHVDPSDNLIIK